MCLQVDVCDKAAGGGGSTCFNIDLFTLFAERSVITRSDQTD